MPSTGGCMLYCRCSCPSSRRKLPPVTRSLTHPRRLTLKLLAMEPKRTTWRGRRATTLSLIVCLAIVYFVVGRYRDSIESFRDSVRDQPVRDLYTKYKQQNTWTKADEVRHIFCAQGLVASYCCGPSPGDVAPHLDSEHCLLCEYPSR